MFAEILKTGSSMYALAFDLEKAQLLQHYGSPHINNAYGEIHRVLVGRGFTWAQGSLYTVNTDDMAVLFLAIQDLMALPWFSQCVRDIRGFRVEQWSDFTPLVRRQSGSGSGTI
jgi:virulence-associated protein VapD